MYRLSRLIVYFCTHMSWNTHHRGYFASERQIHYYKSPLQYALCVRLKLKSFFINHLWGFFYIGLISLIYSTSKQWKCAKVVNVSFDHSQNQASKQASAMSMSELTLFFSKEINRKFGTIWIKCHILTAWNKSNTFVRLEKSLKLGKGLWNAFEYGFELHNH